MANIDIAFRNTTAKNNTIQSSQNSEIGTQCFLEPITEQIKRQLVLRLFTHK